MGVSNKGGVHERLTYHGRGRGSVASRRQKVRTKSFNNRLHPRAFKRTPRASAVSLVLGPYSSIYLSLQQQQRLHSKQTACLPLIRTLACSTQCAFYCCTQQAIWCAQVSLLAGTAIAVLLRQRTCRLLHCISETRQKINLRKLQGKSRHAAETDGIRTMDCPETQQQRERDSSRARASRTREHYSSSKLAFKFQTVKRICSQRMLGMNTQTVCH